MDTPTWQPPPPGDPVATAESFATAHRADTLRLDFTLQSLETDVDRAFDLPFFCRGRDREPSHAEERALSGLCAYAGEALRRNFDGVWEGEFYPTCTILNYYRSRVVFGQFKFNPHSFIASRLTNGPEEGTFTKHMHYCLPSIKARMELTLEHERPQIDRAVCEAMLISAPATWEVIVLRLARKKGEIGVGAFELVLSRPSSLARVLPHDALREATYRLDELHRHFGGFLGNATYRVTRTSISWSYTVDFAYDWSEVSPSDL